MAREKRAAETPAAEVPAVGAIEQLTVASRQALKDGQHAEHAAIEGALFALYNARLKLESVQIDGATAQIKALL
jgi:hypothetical protein